MPDYRYEAIAETGMKNTGTLTASTEQEVVSMLDAKGLFPVRIEAAKSKQKINLVAGTVSPRQMAIFYSQLADLLHAGVPLLRGLDILERQSSEKKLGQVLRDVRAKVADGTTLGDSMSKHPEAFSELAVSMIRAGQEGGFLEEVLRRIAIFTDRQQELKGKVIGAIAYPVFLAVVMVVVLLAMIVFVVPQFEPMFQKLLEDGELPILTQVIIGLSHLIKNWGWLIILGIIGTLFLFRRWTSTDSGRLKVDSFKLKFPIVGNIYLNLSLSRFTRILGTLLQNGIPLLQALKISKDSTGNKVLTNAIDQAATNVTEGNALAEPLRECTYMPRDVVEMVAVGEESNTLERVLLDIATSLENRTNRQLELFVRLLEPVMLLVMAVLVFIVVMGLLLPVFKMSSAV